MRQHKNFKFLVTPVAQDFELKYLPEGMGRRLDNAYGIPEIFDAREQMTIHASSLFFNPLGGAMLLELSL